MANTVAYNNSTNPVGSIKKGVVSINIDNSLITSGLTWRNGIEFTNQYIIYSDTYTQGIDTQPNAKPCAWSCDYNDTALLNLINSLPPLIGQPKYGTLATAIDWLEGQNKYFLVNQNYPEIVTSGCVLNVDAGMSGSYPNVGTTWYDLNSFNNGTLTNGPTWVSSGVSSSFLFDGTDDYVNLGTSISNFTTQLTINFFGKIVGSPSDGILITKGEYDGTATSNFGFQIGRNAGGNSLRLYAKESGQSYTTVDSDANLWNNNIGNYVVTYNAGSVSFYKNGNLFSSHSFGLNSLPSTTGPLYIGFLKGYISRYPGNIYNVSLYNRALSQSEILQNYYRGKLVTSGLTLALDVGNLVSYAGDGTTWYDMTSNGNNGTLTNGPTYSGGTVPCLRFDGIDDYVSLPNNQLPNNFTYSIWVMRDGDGNQGGRGIVISNGSTYIDVNFSNKILFSLILSNGTQNLIQSANGVVAPVGVWAHYVATYNQQQAKLYYNGVEVASSNYTLGVGGYGTTFTIGKYDGGSYNLNGKISNAQYYNRALSASEIQQNFNTYRRRFGI